MNTVVLNFIAIGISVLSVLVALFFWADTRRTYRKVEHNIKGEPTIIQQYTDFQWPANKPTSSNR